MNRTHPSDADLLVRVLAQIGIMSPAGRAAFFAAFPGAAGILGLDLEGVLEMKREHWPVTADDVSVPYGPPDACFYCKMPVGAEHSADCGLRKRTVVCRVSVDMVRLVPESWDGEMIEFNANESSSCASNLLREITEMSSRLDQEGRCPCGLVKVEYLREADGDDEEMMVLSVEGKDTTPPSIPFTTPDEGKPASKDIPPQHRPHEFVFRHGRLHPASISAGHPVGKSDGIDEVATSMGFHRSDKVNRGDTTIYSGDNFRWLFLIGDAGQYALVLVEGWPDYFEAMRYFAPTISFIDRAWREADRDAQQDAKKRRS